MIRRQLSHGLTSSPKTFKKRVCRAGEQTKLATPLAKEDFKK